MRAQFLKYWERLRSSFWFLPTLMAAAAVGLSFLTVALDQSVTQKWLRSVDWVYNGGTEGASAVLQTIAGSMITIAGVVFSLTLVALSLASSQFGPRLLRNFMRDTTNQLVLGTFIATFLYCLLVLRTIRREEGSLFVPHLSVTLGKVFALASLWVLIGLLALGNMGLGLIIPTSMVMALDDHGEIAGLASSLGGTFQMVFGGALVAVLGPVLDGTTVPMVALIAGCAWATVVLALLAPKPQAAAAPATTSASAAS